MNVEFIDSNLFVYLFDQNDERRRTRAREIVENALRNGSGIISYQVVQEVLNVVTHKMQSPLSAGDAMTFCDLMLVPMWRIFPSEHLYRRALDIKQRYSISFYDSLIVAGACEAGCTRLLSEDFQNGQSIEGLQIHNPFL